MSYYKKSGVDIDKANRSVDSIKAMIEKQLDDRVIGAFGGFSSLFEIDTLKYRKPIIVSSTDGVGTKLKIAFLANVHDTIGIDLVAMCVNDLITCGSDPLFFLDYISSSFIKVDIIDDIVRGILKGCRKSSMTLIGGETAEMPGFYNSGDYDLAGFAVGIVDRDDIIDGKNISRGDLIFAFPSNGFHSNGYSLIRYILFEENNFKLSDSIQELEGQLLCDILLTPTRIYYEDLLGLRKRLQIKGIANVTGGGIFDNLRRILPDGLDIQSCDFEIPSLFKWFYEISGLSYEEMFKVFNMGVGMIVVVSSEDVSLVDDELFLIGRVC